MIFVGYQGIGKSSISGNGNIDLESGNFWINLTRHCDWYKVYCNIAKSLSEQGYNVFLSSHKIVRDELKKKKIKFITIFPSLELKEKWIERLQKRYDKTNLMKDYKALHNAIDCYEENIKDLSLEKTTIEIKYIDYDLNEIIENYKGEK